MVQGKFRVEGLGFRGLFLQGLQGARSVLSSLMRHSIVS